MCLAESSSTFPNSPIIAVLSDYIYMDDGFMLPCIILQLFKLASPFEISHRYFIASLLEGLTGFNTTVLSKSPKRASSKRHTRDLY